MRIVNVYEWVDGGLRAETVLDGLNDYWICAVDLGDVDNE